MTKQVLHFVQTWHEVLDSPCTPQQGTGRSGLPLGVDVSPFSLTCLVFPRPTSVHDSHINAAGAFRRHKCHASRQQPTSGAKPASEQQSGASGPQQDAPSKPGSKKKLKSSWDAKEAGRSGKEGDFLSNLGSKQDYNINITHGVHCRLV